MKTRNKTEQLVKTMRALLTRFDADCIFEALTDSAKGTTDEEYLVTEAINYLNLYHGMSVVKMDGLKQQMDFEEMMNKILTTDNERQANLFLTFQKLENGKPFTALHPIPKVPANNFCETEYRNE
jgi:hypothetical protein